ncbi:hypothetical protein ACQ4LE_000379 [Meloidogyne hapla]|uniref:Uncharacterized protein n=1 Tax=Meloidogyne hapla TaxID=6305 RepID=A0A1I8C3T6_MELHA
MSSTSSTETSKIPSITNSKGVHFHDHFNRNQFEKLINLKLKTLTCHDIKCKKEKDFMKKSISRLAQTFTEIFNLYEKQRKDMIIIYSLYNKLCEEFALPYRIERPIEHESRRLAQIAEMIKGIFLKKNDEFKNESTETETMFDKKDKNVTRQSDLMTLTPLNGGFNGGPTNSQFQNLNNNIKNNQLIQNGQIKNDFNENNRKRRSTPFLNKSPSISASLSVQPPSTSTKLPAFLENFGSSPIVSVNLNSPQVNLNNLNQMRQWKIPKTTNCNINGYKRDNTQMVNGNTLHINHHHNHHHLSQTTIPQTIPQMNGVSLQFKHQKPQQPNNPHFLRSSNIENLNSSKQQFTVPTASALVVSSQELLLHELLGVSEKRAKFTSRKANCDDEIEVIELDD